MLIIAPIFVFAPFSVPAMPFNPLGFAVFLFFMLLIYTVCPGIVGGVVGVYLGTAHSSGDLTV